MRRLIACLLVFALFTGCSASGFSENSNDMTENSNSQKETNSIVESIGTSEGEILTVNGKEYSSLNDPELLEYVEYAVYQELVSDLNSEDYFVENVSAIYISQEYIDELMYNSQSNIYFGFTLAELDEAFQDTRYVFTLGDDGKTVVQEFQEYDNSYNQMIANVAVGTGVIVVCVVISCVSKVAGATAVASIFAYSAKVGAITAVSEGFASGVVSGVTTGIETKDLNAAIQSAVLEGSKGFKWGAIIGSIAGGTGKAASLYGATRNGLTMNQAALIQQESKLPLEFIKNFHSMEEYYALKNSNLFLSKVNGKNALVQTIDWDFIGDIDDGRTNAQRVLDGVAPLDLNGESYELHHIGQMSDSPLAILTSSQHKGNYSILHANTGGSASKIDRTLFEKQKREFWKSLLESSQGGIE